MKTYFAHTWVLTFGLLCLACGSGLSISPPAPDLLQNPGQSQPSTTLVVFQGGVDVAAQNPVHIDVPLPTRPVEARLYLQGHLLTTLFYTEVAQHHHTAQNATTNTVIHNHTHGLLTGFTGTGSFNGISTFWGAAGCPQPTASGLWYRRTTDANSGCTITGGQNVLESDSWSHAHTLTAIVDPAGIQGMDENAIALEPAIQQKTYPDHLLVYLNDEDMSESFQAAPLGNGTTEESDTLNTTGVVADLSERINQAGHHRLSFYIGGDSANRSLGGRVNYTLWLRVENTAFASLSDSGS